jgi:hypothetical protein
MPDPISATIGAGASLLGGFMSNSSQSSSASKAADASYAAAKLQSDTTKEMFETTRMDFAPFLQAGKDALGKYMGMLGQDFKLDEADPVYQWRQKENERTVNQFMASRGKYDSRAAANMLLNSGMALQADETDRQYGAYLNKFNQLLPAIQTGSGAAGNMGQLSSNTSNQLANIWGTHGTNAQNALLQQGAANAQMWQGIGNLPANTLAQTYYAKKLFG